MAYVDKQGGISNGEIINMRIAFKPTSTISVSSLSLSYKPACMCAINTVMLDYSLLSCQIHLHVIFYLFLNDILFGIHRAVGYKPNVPYVDCTSQSKPTVSTVSLFEKRLFVWMQHIFTLNGISC